MSKPEVNIEDWIFAEFPFPRLSGISPNHPYRAPDRELWTSRILDPKPQYVQGDRVETKNSIYILGAPANA